MTEQELEVIRVNLRIEVLKVLVGGLYSALARQSPNVAPALLASFQSLRKEHARIALKGIAPEYSDLISAEYQEALDETISEIERLLRKG